MKNRIVGVRHGLHNTDRCVGQQDAALERLTELFDVVLQRRGFSFGPGALQQNSGAMKVRLEGIDVDGVCHYYGKGVEGLDALE
jgi:hypothetical protein